MAVYGEKKHWWLRNKKVCVLLLLLLQFSDKSQTNLMDTVFVQCFLSFFNQIVDKYMKEAKNLIASKDPNDVESALSLLESALSVSPRYELALELKARSLLYLRRFKDVADMLHDYIPSLKFSGEDSGIGSSESSRESVSLLNELPSHGGESGDSSFKCFSVSDLKKKVMAGLSKNCNEQGQWR